jgi:thiamine-phosphate pyrophosphorylase
VVGSRLFADPASRFYPIIDDDICRSRALSPRAIAAACFRGGARVLQLRVKSGGSARFLELAGEIVEAARPFGAAVIVNDRADVARLAGAAGVHVGQEDLPPGEVRGMVGNGVIGLSTHDLEQVDAGLASEADYVAVGPIFGTATKDTGYEARGLDLLRRAAHRGKPIVAIGGITLERAASVIAAGAASVAVIADVLTGGDPEARTREYLRIISPQSHHTPQG